MLPERLTPLVLETSHEIAMTYGALTEDFNPIHCDPEFAAESAFGRAICHGTMALNLILEAAERSLPGVEIRDLTIRFSRPMPVGEILRATGRLAGPATYEVAVDLSDGTRALEGALAVAPDTGVPA